MQVFLKACTVLARTYFSGYKYVYLSIYLYIFIYISEDIYADSVLLWPWEHITIQLSCSHCFLMWDCILMWFFQVTEFSQITEFFFESLQFCIQTFFLWTLLQEKKSHVKHAIYICVLTHVRNKMQMFHQLESYTWTQCYLKAHWSLKQSRILCTHPLAPLCPQLFTSQAFHSSGRNELSEWAEVQSSLLG